METVCFERKAFEEFAMKIERFIHRVEGIPIWIWKAWRGRLAGSTTRMSAWSWKSASAPCRPCDNGTLAYTKIGNRTYYLPEDVERIVTKVEDRRKDARYRGHTIWRNWTEVSTKDKWAVCIIEFISNNWLKRSLIYLCDLKSSIDVLRQDSPPS